MRVNVSACPPASIASTSQVTASSLALRRASESLPNGAGFHSTKYFRPRGEPSSSITVISRPINRPANSPGLAIVALAAKNTGRDP